MPYSSCISQTKRKIKNLFFPSFSYDMKECTRKKVQVENKNLTERCRISHFLKKKCAKSNIPGNFCLQLEKNVRKVQVVCQFSIYKLLIYCVT